MTKQTTYVGGCLCGHLRYEVRDLIDAGYCHCRLCQRSTGAPVLAWATFPNVGFSYSKGKPQSYRSSPKGLREFCAACGTQIAFHGNDAPTRIDINIASLDEPASIEPEYHVWVGSRVPWFHIQDDLPRYTDDGPETPNS
jgi:hypothetical protein